MAKDVKIQIVGDASKYKAALADASSATGKFAGNTKKAGESFTKFGIGGLAVAGAIGAGLLQTGKSASALGESVNAVNVTFGKSAAGILKLGENAAKSVGLSNVAFNGLAVQFSSFATTIAGKGGDVVKTMDEMTTRAADFASVMDTDVANAAAMFQSGLAGETEPLKKFGIDLSAAAVEAYAAANGIGTLGEQLSESEKVTARYGSLMEQTAKTQGDFANTSDSAANAARSAGAELENASAAVGASFTPIMAFAAQTVGKLANGFAALNDKTGGWLAKGAGIAAVGLGAASAFSLVVGQVSKVSAAFDTARGGLTSLSGRFRNAEGGLTKMGTAAGVASKALLGIGIAAAGLEVIDQLSEDAGRAGDAMNKFIVTSDGMKGVKGNAEDVLRAFADMAEQADKSEGVITRSWSELPHLFDQSGVNLDHMTESFNELLSTSPAAVEQVVAAMEAELAAANSGDKAAQKYLETKSLTASVIAKFREQLDNATGAQEVLTGATEDSAAATEEATAATEAETAAKEAGIAKYKLAVAASDAYVKAQEEAQAAEEDHIEVLLDQAEALKDQAEALDESSDKFRAAADANYALIDATEAYDDHLDGLKDALKEAGDDQDAINKIYRDGTESAASVADAVNRLADEQSASLGVTRSATASLDTWNRSMLDSATKAGPAQRAEILRYIAQVNNIPEAKVTEIQALIDEGKLDEADIALAYLSKTRQAKVVVDANTATATADIEALRIRQEGKPLRLSAHLDSIVVDGETHAAGSTTISGVRVGGTTSRRLSAAGGVFSAVPGGHDITIAEGGRDEAVVPLNDDGSIPGTEGSGGTGVVIQNLTINMPVGSDGDAVIRTIQQFERRNGPGWRS